MKLNDFIGIHRESNYTIKKIDDYYFINRGLINYSFPQLIEIPINNRLINTLKWRYLISVIKTKSRIKNNYEYILKSDSYELDDFRKRTRTTIRKSLKCCVFKTPLFKDLLHAGLKINRQTLKLQKRRDEFLSKLEHWEKYISQFYNNEDSIILGAYFGKKMIGYAIAYKLEGKHYFHLQHIDRDYSTYYPMSGLMYTIVNRLIKENGTIEISDGIESFNPLPTLNRFKTYMRFNRVPISRVYVLHPMLIVIFKPILFFYLRILGKRNVRNQWVRKIITLYQGHRMISKIISETSTPPISANEYIYQE
ncbi:MAG: hypothetical protein JEZ14_15340 [Marinilabiliaceae bacterium]|nr:hypothetical protein [Marinilabiliaceae bacterium]